MIFRFCKFVFICVLGHACISPTLLAQVPPKIPDPADAEVGAIYELDAQHSLLDFTARHLGFGRVRGTFNEYRAAAFITPDDLSQSSFRLVAEISSLDTQNPGRDQLLQDEFFAVNDYPYLTFSSKAIRPSGEAYVMVGDLQIRDVTRTIEIPFSVITLDGLDQWQNRRIALEGHLTINRNDYNVVYDNEFWNGIVSDSIEIDISFGAVRYNALNDIFPWRKSGIATVIRDGITEDGLDATLERVRMLFAEERHNWNFGFGQFYRVGRMLYQTRRFEEAEAVLKLAIDILKDTAAPVELADLNLGLAELEWARGNPKDALAHVHRALSIDPMNPVAFLLSRQLQ